MLDTQQTLAAHSIGRTHQATYVVLPSEKSDPVVYDPKRLANEGAVGSWEEDRC